MSDSNDTYQTIADAVRKAEALAELARRDAQEVKNRLQEIHYVQQDFTRRIDHVEAELSDLHKDFQGMNAIANRWKGGFIVLVALGGVVTWLSSVGGNILKVFK